MKICPKCFAEYDETEVDRDRCFCIECYGESDQVNVIDYSEFMANANIKDILARRRIVEGSNCAESSKHVILRRIDRIVAELRNR